MAGISGASSSGFAELSLASCASSRMTSTSAAYARGPRLVAQEAVDAFRHEPFLPAPDAGLRFAGPTHDVAGADAIGAQQYDGRAPSVFCETLRSLVIASRRPRTDRVIVMDIPVRMRQIRTRTEPGESQSGLFCQAETTR